jgi:cation diffusion facilitator family transporter
MHLVAPGQPCDPFPPHRHFDDSADRDAAQRAIRFSAVGLAATGIFELMVALLTGSVGLLGDALHNLSDVSTSLVVFVGFRMSRRPASPSHPYGYERAEDLAGLGVALVIWASAVFAGVVSVHKLTEHGQTSHLGLGVTAAAIGIIGNQVVARYKGRIGHRIQSATLVADAQHSWLDALSSAGALLGLVGVAFGLQWADAIAGIVVTLFIVHVGWDVTGDLLVHLMDGIDPQTLVAVGQTTGAVTALHHSHVRARWMGRSLIIEVEGFVAPNISIHEADEIGRLVEDAVYAGVPEARVVLWCARPMPTRSSDPYSP